MGKFTLTIEELIENNVTIFDFNYNFYNDNYKKDFEQKFIDTFYYEEIGTETIKRFKHNLKATLNKIMPYYTHLYKTTLYEYDPILNYHLKEEIKKDTATNQDVSNNNKDDVTNYDTPINFDSENYKNSPSFITENSSVNNSNIKGSHNENLTRETKGNIGVMSTQDLIRKERDIIINIDEMILEELNTLFMGVY